MGVRFLAAFFAVLFMTTALAAPTCDDPTFGRVVIEGIGEIRYGTLFADSRADRAEFTGGVCLTAVDGSWAVRTNALVLSELSKVPLLSTTEVTVEMDTWTIHSASLTGTTEVMTFYSAEFSGPDNTYYGSAEKLTADLGNDTIGFNNFYLIDSLYVIEAVEGVMHGTEITLIDTVISTCLTCLEGKRAIFNIVGPHAVVDIERARIDLRSGVVHILGVPVPLAEKTEISERTLSTFELPLDVREISSLAGPARNGTGLLFVLKNMHYISGMKLEAGLVGFDRPETFGVVAVGELHPQTTTEADGTQSTSNATVGIRANRPYASISVERPLGEHTMFSTQFFTGADYGRDYRHEGIMRVRNTGTPNWLPGTLHTEAFMGALALAGNPRDLTQLVPNLPMSDARFGVQATHSLQETITDGISFRLQTTAQETYYPGHQQHQWGVRLAPELQMSFSPVNISVSYLALFSNEGSPFPTSIDRLTRTQRLTGSVGVNDFLPFAASSSFRVSTGYDFAFAGARREGLRNLTTSLSAGFSLSEAWTLSTSINAELGKLIDNRAMSNASVTLAATAERSGVALVGTNPGGTLEFGTQWRYAFTPTQELTLAEFSAGVPLVFPTMEVKPWLSFDFSGLITGYGPPVDLYGHGVDVTFITCCGSFMVGYRLHNTDWDIRLGIDLYRRLGPTPEEAEQGMITD